jgi:hypothetical protein
MSYEFMEFNLRRQRVNYFNLRDKMRQKRKIKDKLKQFNNFLNTYGLQFNNIEITSLNSNIFELTIEQDIPETQKAAICQTARDNACMSERAYKDFRKTVKPLANLATLAECNAYKKKLNEVWATSAVSDDENKSYIGTFIDDPVQKIKFVCRTYIERIRKHDPEQNVENNTFNLLLCGDSLQLTKTHLNLLNFCFSLINDGDLSHNGLYTLG